MRLFFIFLIKKIIFKNILVIFICNLLELLKIFQTFAKFFKVNVSTIIKLLFEHMSLYKINKLIG